MNQVYRRVPAPTAKPSLGHLWEYDHYTGSRVCIKCGMKPWNGPIAECIGRHTEKKVRRED